MAVEKLFDRFGSLPQNAVNLLYQVCVKGWGCKRTVTTIGRDSNQLVLKSDATVVFNQVPLQLDRW